MAEYKLRLFHDRIGAGRTARVPTACNRVIYCRWGGVAVSGQSAELVCDGACLCTGPVSVTGSIDGAQVWRWELVRADESMPGAADGAVESHEVLSADMTLESPHGYLIRCDSVNFPLGGVAYLHVHEGGGIRCVHHGEIRVDLGNDSRTYRPGEAWYEPGPIPVFVKASDTQQTGFVRVMVLPRTLLGRSSITYLRDEDKDKPKTQKYKVYIDECIEL